MDRVPRLISGTVSHSAARGCGLYLDRYAGTKGEVIVDTQLRTTHERIWAAGDVTGLPQFVYVAGVHGTVVVDNAFDGASRTIDYRTMPRVIFTSSNIAAVGLTEAEAQRAGLDCESRSIPLDLVPRARSIATRAAS